MRGGESIRGHRFGETAGRERRWPARKSEWRAKVRWALAHHPDDWLSCRPEKDDGDDHERANDDPDGVAARVSGLRVADGIADGGGAAGYAVDGAINSRNVDDFPEHIRRNPHERLDHNGGVELIDVIFVQQRVVDRPQ